MTEKQRQRVERRVNIMPYTTASWDPLQDLSLSGSTVWDQVKNEANISVAGFIYSQHSLVESFFRLAI